MVDVERRPDDRRRTAEHAAPKPIADHDHLPIRSTTGHIVVRPEEPAEVRAHPNGTEKVPTKELSRHGLRFARHRDNGSAATGGEGRDALEQLALTHLLERRFTEGWSVGGDGGRSDEGEAFRKWNR